MDSLLKRLPFSASFFVALSLLPSKANASIFDCQSQLTTQEQAALVPKVEAEYRKISDLKAKFVQFSYFLGLDERRSSQGEVFFKKPGMMDWLYESPEVQRFVADGSVLWYFQPELNQVTIGEFRQSFSSDLPVAFLFGVGDLQEKFILQSACNADGGISLKLKPKKAEESLEEFFLLVESDTKTPKGARILDAGGNETTIIFQDVAFNQGVDAKRFQFEVPRGVDVIDNRKEQDVPIFGGARREIVEEDVK